MSDAGSSRSLIAVTVGEPGGIGPEVAWQAACSARVGSRIVLTGPGNVVEAARGFAGGEGPALVRVEPEALRETVESLDPDDIPLIDTGDVERTVLDSGGPSAAAGEVAMRDTSVGCRLALGGSVDALVSAPVSKQSLWAAGYEFPGQTEALAHLSGVQDVLTILVGGPLRVALLTSHCSLLEAIRATRRSRIVERIRGLVDALETGFKIDDPRIWVSGLNPHAGDQGLLGREDMDEIVPAVEVCREIGLDVTGPLPADSLFQAAESSPPDGIVAMYHDQGVVPLKRHNYATFAHGLPFVRTTAGHGTAYDIAWKGVAEPAAMIKAVELAEQLLSTNQSRS